MARQRTPVPLTGKWANKIGYERDGQFFLRSAPEKVNQTPATIRAAKRFGRYCRKARVIRHAFYPDLDVRCDTSHVNRLNKVLINAAGNHAAIKGFRFNEQTGIDRFFTLKPELTRNGILHIPAQDISYAHFTALEVKAIAVRIDFNTGQVTGTDTVTAIFDGQQPFSGINIPLYIPGEGTLVLTLQVRGMFNDGPSCNKHYLAADIVAVISSQTPERLKTHPQRQQPPASKPITTTSGPHTYHISVRRE